MLKECERMEAEDQAKRKLQRGRGIQQPGGGLREDQKTPGVKVHRVCKRRAKGRFPHPKVDAVRHPHLQLIT